MKRIVYDFEIDTARKKRVDALYGKSIFEYRINVNDIRMLQSALIFLSGIIAELPNYNGILILDKTKISGLRLREEWESYARLIQPFILSRLKIVVISKGETIEKYGKLSKEESDAILEITKTISQKQINKKRSKPDAFFEIVRILIIHWFRGNGPTQLNKLCQLSGFSYPTVALSLEKMELQINRHSDRSVELKSFPRDLWFKLLASSDNIRVPQGFWAHRPRDIDYLIKKIIDNTNFEIGFGGIIGARHFMPSIDLLGNPRLDLTVQKWSNSKVENFVKNLDPGLKKVRPGELPQVVIHNLFRQDPLFVKSSNMLIADEVECLLDLHEARLELQASELLEHLKGDANR